MSAELDQAIEVLQDQRAGWVHRRDAVHAVREHAGRALAALKAHADDSDRDVRDAVLEALGTAQAALQGIEAVPAIRAHTLDELVEYVKKPGSRDVAATNDGYDITVALRDGRKQIVHVRTGKSQAGDETVQVSTRCGPATERGYKWALRNNTGLTHCGMALVEHDGREYFDMVNAFLSNNVTPEEFKACVKELAFYGDWAESKLTEGDAF